MIKGNTWGIIIPQYKNTGVKQVNKFPSEENQFKAGQSGNPSGRPKGTRNRSTIIKEILDAKATDGEGGTIADQLTRALVQKAATGDVSAFRELMDGAFGKITDKVENTHSYTQMGRVNVGGAELTFDVGSPPDNQ